jgi:hypothetical protein
MQCGSATEAVWLSRSMRGGVPTFLSGRQGSCSILDFGCCLCVSVESETGEDAGEENEKQIAIPVGWAVLAAAGPWPWPTSYSAGRGLALLPHCMSWRLQSAQTAHGRRLLLLCRLLRICLYCRVMLDGVQLQFSFPGSFCTVLSWRSSAARVQRASS